MSAYRSYGRRGVDPATVPQSAPLSGQVQNDAGGYAYPVTVWTQLDRFLILGSALPTYYVSSRELTRQNAVEVEKAIAEDGLRVVARTVEISEAGRAPKNDPALFVLALAASVGDAATKRAAFEALPVVARIGTHLLHFVSYAESLRGWGRGLKRAVASWLTDRSPDALAYQAVKYQSRDAWALRDVVRLSHPNPTAAHCGQAVLRWIARGWEGDELPTATVDGIPDIVRAFERAKRADQVDEVVELIRRYHLPREAVPTQWLAERPIWEALFDEALPVTALLRNLPTLTRLGVLDDPERRDRACARLTDPEVLRAGRVHPVALLIAEKTYTAGSGRGSTTWTPSDHVIVALNAAFYAAFAAVEPTRRRYLLALDVSGSMTLGGCAGAESLSPREASAALALVTMAVEPHCEIVGFTAGRSQGSVSSQGECVVTPLELSPVMGLGGVVQYTKDLPYGGTDCALPMLYALEQRREIDTFVVYTDNETWAGSIHPSEALRRYRRETGIAAKLIVVGMTSDGFSIADPSDSGMLDVVGFDSAVPEIMRSFVAGE